MRPTAAGTTGHGLMQLKVVKEEVGRRNEGRLRTALKFGLMQCNESEKKRPRALAEGSSVKM